MLFLFALERTRPPAEHGKFSLFPAQGLRDIGGAPRSLVERVMARGPPGRLLLHDNGRAVRLNISLVNYLAVSHQLRDNIPDLVLWLGQLWVL